MEPTSATRTEISPNHGAGIASMVMGVFSLISIFVMAPLGIIFGIIGMVQAKRDDSFSNSFAYAGHITSKTGLIINIIITILVVIIAVVLGQAIMFGLGNLLSQAG